MRTFKYRNAEYAIRDMWENNGVISVKGYKTFEWGYSIVEVIYVDGFLRYEVNQMTNSDVEYFILKRGEQ